MNKYADQISRKAREAEMSWFRDMKKRAEENASEPIANYAKASMFELQARPNDPKAVAEIARRR